MSWLVEGLGQPEPHLPLCGGQKGPGGQHHPHLQMSSSTDVSGLVPSPRETTGHLACAVFPACSRKPSSEAKAVPGVAGTPALLVSLKVKLQLDCPIVPR